MPTPDLILLDLNMPRMDGHQFLAEVKTDPALSSIPIVVVTTSDEDADIVESYRLHANAYVTKPIGLEQMGRSSGRSRASGSRWSGCPPTVLGADVADCSGSCWSRTTPRTRTCSATRSPSRVRVGLIDLEHVTTLADGRSPARGSARHPTWSCST